MAKKEKLKSDEFDFDEELNFDDLGFGDDDGFEVKDDRTPVTKVISGGAEGVKDTLTDPGFIRKTVLESLPKEYGETYAKVDEVGTGVVRLYNDAVKEVKPTFNRVIKQVDKLIPQESKRTREFLEKIKEFVGEDHNYKQLSKEQQEEQSIQNSLGAIFQTQGEEQVRQRHEDQAQELIQNQVEKDRFEKEVDLMWSIDNNLSKLTQYNEKINQAYQKKTLELQFRGYFLQQDMLATTKKYFEVFEKQNEAITKNTALPEFVKITRAESFKEHMRQKFNTSVTSGLFGDNDFVKKGFERLGTALKSKLQEFKTGLEDGVSAAAEAKDAFGSQEEGGMGVDKYDFVGKMLGSQGVEKLGGIIGKRVREKFESSDSEWAQKVKKWGFKGATAAGNLPGFLSNVRNSEALQSNWEDGTIKAMLKEATGWVLDQFTEQSPDMVLDAAPGMNKLGTPAIFDNKVHRSITEIIPGFLSRILQELQITRTGDSSVPLTRFDLDNGTFSTTKKLAEKIKAKLKSDALSTGYERKLDESVDKFMGDAKFDGKTKEVLKSYLKDLSFEGGDFNPKDMLNEKFISKVPASKRKAFKKFIEERYTQDTVDSAKNNFIFSTDMVNLRKTIADQRGSIQTFENAGYGDILRDIGLVGNERNSSAINMSAYKNLLLSDKDERKLAAKEAYQRAADGKPEPSGTKHWDNEGSEALRQSDNYKPGGSFKIEEVSLEPITKRLDAIIENMKDGPKDGTALSDIRAKKNISKFDPKQALENIKNTKVFKWMYKKGRGDEQAHVGPMAQDVNKAMGDEAAPEGTSIDLVSLNGNNMAAIEALRQEQEVIKEKVGTKNQNETKQKPVGLLEAIKQDTGTIVDLLSNKGIVIGSFPSIEFNTDGVEKLAKAFSDSMADYKERSFEFFESMQKKLSEVSGFGMSMPEMPSFKKLKESKAAKKVSEYSGKFKEKAKTVGSSMWAGTKSLFNFGKERAKDTGEFLKRQYQEKKDPVKAGIGRVFKSSFDIAGSVLRGANRIVTETLPAGIREVKDLLKTVRDKALDILDQPVDIYVLGNPNPVMQALLMKMGHYFDQTTGKPITKPSQIVGPVVDRSGNYVLTAQDFATGIVDKDGNKIESPVKKLIGIGVRAVANGISAANNIVRNVLSIGKGGGEKLLDGFKGMVKKLFPTDMFGFGFDKSHKVLLDIREILNRRLPGEPMVFSDTSKEVSVPVVKEPSASEPSKTQTSLFPEAETDTSTTGAVASELLAKIAEGKIKVRSLFQRAKNAAGRTVKDLKQNLPVQKGGADIQVKSSVVDKLKNKSQDLKQKAATFLDQAKQKGSQVKEAKWATKPLIEKLNSPKKSLSDFASNISGWLQKESIKKDDKETVDDIEVKVSEPTSADKEVKDQKKSVFERITEFTVSGKGKFAELVGNKLVKGIKGDMFAKLFYGVKDSGKDEESDVLEDNKPDTKASPTDASPKYMGSGLFGNLKRTIADKLNLVKQSAANTTVTGTLAGKGVDIKEKIAGLFGRLKESGVKAKAVVSQKLNGEQVPIPTGTQSTRSALVPTTLLGGIKSRTGRIAGAASGLFGGALGALSNLLPGNKNQIAEQQDKPAKDDQKPGALDEIKDLLTGLFKRREGPEIDQTKSRFNDRDGDGDRDGNAQEQFDKIEARKKEREAQTDKTVASLDPKYRSSENIIDTMINKAKGLMGGGGVAAAAGAGGSLLGTAADVAGGLFGRGGRNAPQTTVPGGAPGVPAKTPSKLGRFLKGGAKVGLGAGAAYGLFHLAEKARENGDETTSDALSMAGNAAGLYSAFQVLRGGAGLLAGTGGAAGAAGAATSGALGAVGTAASGAASVGGTLLGGAGSAVMAALASPWVAIPATIALTGYVGYKAYKYLNRNKASPAEAFRMAQYGLSKSSSDFYPRIYGLEEYFNRNAIGYSDGKAYIIEKNVKPEEILKILEVDVNDKRTLDNSLSWFMTRFKPIYLSHLTALLAVDRKLRLEDLNDLPKDKMDIYLNAVEYPEGPYNSLTSPFKDLPALTAGPSEVSQAFKEAKTGDQSFIKKPIAGKPLESGDKKDATKIPEPSKESSVVSDIANGLLSGATLGKYSSFSDIKLPSWKEVVDYSSGAANSAKMYIDKTAPSIVPGIKELGTNTLRGVENIKDSVSSKIPSVASTIPDGSLVPTSADPIIGPVQNSVVENISPTGLAAGGLGLAGAMALGRKKAAPAPQSIADPTAQQAAQTIPSQKPPTVQTAGQKPSLFSKVKSFGSKLGSVVKSRGLKLGLAGGAAYGLFHLAEKARENGNETLSDALSMGGNAAGAYGAFQGLSGIASMMAGTGGVTGALGTAGTAVSSGIGALGSGAATVGGSFLGGVGSALGAVALNPLFYVPAAVGLLGYGGYKAYKAYRRVKPSPTTKLRLTQYGLNEQTSGHYSKVLKLEEYLNKEVIGYNGGQAYLIEKNISPETVFNILGVSPTDAEGRSKALQWFTTRFKPVYLNHLTTLYSVAPKTRLEDVDGLTEDQKYRYLSGAQMPDGPYNELMSPFPELPSLPADSVAVAEAYRQAVTKDGKIPAGDKRSIFEPTQPKKLDLVAKAPVQDIAQRETEVKQQVAEDTVRKASSALSISSITDSVKKFFVTPTPQFSTKIVKDDTSELTALEAIRFKMYGLQDMRPSEVSAMRAMESSMYDFVQINANLEVSVNVDGPSVLENLGGLFGVSMRSDYGQRWLRWYFKRFLPTFTTFIGNAYKAIPTTKYSGLEKLLKPSAQYDVALALAGLNRVWTVDDGPYADRPANRNPFTMDRNLAYLKANIGKETVGEKTAPESLLQPAKTQLPIAKPVSIPEPESHKPAQQGFSPQLNSAPDGDFPIERNKSTSPLKASLPDRTPDFGPESEESIANKVDRPPKKKAPVPEASVQSSVKPPPVPEATGPMKSGVGGSKYVKKADSGVNLEGLNPLLAKHLLGMAQEYGEKTGQSVVINSAYRSYAQQEALHRANPKKAAKPGRSLHEKGLALDINEQVVNKLESLGLMRKYGFTRPVGQEGWHVEPAGVQVNLDRSKNDPQFATQAIAASPGRGGGGAWNLPGVKKYGRNQNVALATFNANTTTPLEPTKGNNGNEIASVLPAKKEPPVQQTLGTPKAATAGANSAPIQLSDKSNGTRLTGYGGSRAVPDIVPSGELQSAKLSTPVIKTTAGITSHPDAEPNNLQGKPRQLKSAGKESIKEVIAEAAKKAGVQPDYLQTIAAIESTLNPQAASPGGKAVGLFQFQPRTWTDITQRAGGKYGITPATPRTDPYASTLMAAEYAKANEKVIKKYKPDPAAADFYLPHFMGPSGGLRMVKADPNSLASEVNPEAAVDPGNSSMFFKDKNRTQPFTVAEFYNNIVAKLKRRASEFGIKFTDKFYDQADYKQPKIADTSGSREEAELTAVTKPRVIGFNKDKEQPGIIPGTVSDKPNRYPVFAQSNPTRPLREFDQYSTGTNKSGEYKISGVEVTGGDVTAHTRESYPVSQPASVNQPALKPITGLDAQSPAPELAKQTQAYEKSAPSLTGMVNSVFGSVLGTNKPTSAKDLGNNSNLAAGVNTTAIILNESLSVQRQMLDVLKGILVKTSVPVARQSPEAKPQPAIKATVAEAPVQAEVTEVKQEKGFFANIFGNSPEALPKPAVSLKRTLA